MRGAPVTEVSAAVGWVVIAGGGHRGLDSPSGRVGSLGLREGVDEVREAAAAAVGRCLDSLWTRKA